MARYSFASPGASPRAPDQRWSIMNERFDVLSAASAKASRTRLCQQKRRIPLCDNDTFVSTAIAPNGCIAAATSLEIRLFDLEKEDRTKDVKPYVCFPLKPISKGESIRGVAISDDLLAVVTHLRLVVYEYRDNKTKKDFESNNLGDIRLDPKAVWIPRSVSILQIASSDTYQSAAAWIAVGGEGPSGVKLYQFSRTVCWNKPYAFQLSLYHRECTGAVYKVGFSKFVRMNSFIVYAVTSDNRVICWTIQVDSTGKPTSTPGKPYNANSTRLPSPHRGDITSVEIFETPAQTPYIFVATNQKHGSQLARSFLAPLNASSPSWRPLPEKTAGRQMLSAAVTQNGRYIVLVEKGRMRALTVRAQYEGGLTCEEESVEWASHLCDTAKDTSAIALCLKEDASCLGEAESCFDVTGVDGRGHLVSARVTVPRIVPTVPPSLTWCAPLEPVELRSRGSVREIEGVEVGRETRVDSAVSEGVREQLPVQAPQEMPSDE